MIFYLKLFLPKFTFFLFFATAHGKRTELWTLLSRVDHFYIPLQKGVSFRVYFRHILHAVPVRNALSKLFWSFSLSKIFKFECCLEGGGGGGGGGVLPSNCPQFTRSEQEREMSPGLLINPRLSVVALTTVPSQLAFI